MRHREKEVHPESMALMRREFEYCRSNCGDASHFKLKLSLAEAKLRAEIRARMTTPYDLAESKDPDRKLRTTPLNWDRSESQVDRLTQQAREL